MTNRLISAEWYGFADPEGSVLQYLLMKEENFAIKDIGISYTELNYWDKKELLPITRETESEWRKFDFFNIVWLGIIRELRSFGVATKLIRDFKESIFTPIDTSELKKEARHFIESIEKENETLLDKQITYWDRILKMESTGKDDTLTYFEFWLLSHILRNEAGALLFFGSGEVAFWKLDSEIMNDVSVRLKRANESHFSIALNTILCDLIEENLIVPYLPYLSVMSTQEAELLTIIRNGEYDSVTITFDKQRPNFVLLKKSLPTDRRKISEVLLEGDYQNIQLVQHRGKVTMIENERKISFPDLNSKP